MDAITLIVNALVTGAVAALKPTANQAVKEAYASIKELIKRKFAKVEIDKLEAKPTSEGQKQVVKEDLEEAGAAQDEELLTKALALLKAIEQHDPEAPDTVGVDLEDIKVGVSLKIADIISQGTGVKIKSAEVAQDLIIQGVRAGVTQDPPPASSEAATPVQPIKILFLAANPTDGTRLRLDEEVREIDGALRKSEHRDHFDLEQQWAVRVQDLQAHLLRFQPTIVHFSGHGSSAGELIFEDTNGQSQSVPPTALSNLFRTLKDNIRCVVLNACYSEPQAKAIAEHIDCVVGMSKAIGDRAAINFSTAFYQALGYGRNVKTAFDLATNQIDLASLNEQDTPKLIALKNDPANVFVLRQGEPSVPKG